MQVPRQNNFDLIRLFAALQVFIYHGSSHYKVLDKIPYFATILNQFPGVPIFFFISGFLITSSYNNPNNNIVDYFRNRFLRIYPALWVCLIFTICLLFAFKEINITDSKFYLWVFAQATFFQNYSPSFLNSWGIGNPNGSLWSIVVELQFYIILPLLCFWLNKQEKLLIKNIILISLFTAGFFFYRYLNIHIGNNPYLDLNEIENQQKLIGYKILSTSIICNLYFFIVGIFFYYNFNYLKKWVENKALIWILVYITYFYFVTIYNNIYLSPIFYSPFDFISLILLAFTTFSIAFTKPHLAEKLLNQNDISYGIYIYHMPIINTIIMLNLANTSMKILITSIIVINLAILSWHLVEKRVMKLKRQKV